MGKKRHLTPRSLSFVVTVRGDDDLALGIRRECLVLLWINERLDRGAKHCPLHTIVRRDG